MSKCRPLILKFKRKRERFFGFLYYHFFLEKAQKNKNKVIKAVTETTIFIHNKSTGSKDKALHDFTFVLGRTKGVFLKAKKTKDKTNILLRTGYHRRNVYSNPVAAGSSRCHKDRCHSFRCIVCNCIGLLRIMDESGIVERAFGRVEHPRLAVRKTNSLFALVLW